MQGGTEQTHHVHRNHIEAHQVKRREIIFLSENEIHVFVYPFRQENIDQPIPITHSFCRADVMLVLPIIKKINSYISLQLVQLRSETKSSHNLTPR